MNYITKPLIENACGLYVGNFIRELLGSKPAGRIDLSDERGAFELTSLADSSSVSVTVGEDNFLDKVQLTFVESNLGRGFVFFFNCSECGRKCRCLYSTICKPNLSCRVCQRLIYRKQKESDKRISKLVKDISLLRKYADSPKWVDRLLAIKAWTIRKAIEEQAVSLVDIKGFRHV